MAGFTNLRRSLLGIPLLLLLCAAGAPVASSEALVHPGASVSNGHLAAAALSARLEVAEVGYLLLDLESGSELASLNPDLPLIPASTAKLATAIVALDVLGPEHRYRTELLAAGEIQGGVLKGDLILKGDGDPALEVADLLALAVRLQMSGIRRVEGRLLIDDTALPRFSEIEPTQPPEAAYNPGLGALSLASNRVSVAWRGEAGGDLAPLPPLSEARIEPTPPSLLPSSGIEFVSAGSQGPVWRVADPGGSWQEIVLPVKDAGQHVGHVFRWLVLAQGIELGVPERGIAPAEAHLLAVHESAPLRRLLSQMLVHSNNMMAEMIGLTAAQRLGGTASGLAAAGTLLLHHLDRLMPEVDWQGAVLGNHSGLDSTARMTPRQLAAILRYGWQHEALAALLANGGLSGTLSNRFRGTANALRVWAKSGTLNYGIALAGYLFPENRRPAIFVTMAADLAARASYDQLARPDAAAKAAAGVWNAGVRALQDKLVEGWLHASASRDGPDPVLHQSDRTEAMAGLRHAKRPSMQAVWTGANELSHSILPPPAKPTPPPAEARLVSSMDQVERGAGARERYVLARALLQRGEPAAAEQELRRVLQADREHALAYYDLGYLFLQQGRYAEAAENFRFSIRLAAGGAHAFYGLGAALSRLGELDEAIAHFEHAVELDPDNPFIYYDWGWALEHLGQLDQAQEKYRLAITADPSSRAAINASMRLGESRQ
jgi:serine-type D-Ala-D-Ala carboxypeptidase/endopeptidase (penicillin-binding protein 4)